MVKRRKTFSPGFAGRCPKAEVAKATQPLTCTLFDPDHFGLLRENVFVSNWLNVPEYLRYGTSFRVRAKNWHTGSHGVSQGQENAREKQSIMARYEIRFIFQVMTGLH